MTDDLAKRKLAQMITERAEMERYLAERQAVGDKERFETVLAYIVALNGEIERRCGAPILNGRSNSF